MLGERRKRKNNNEDFRDYVQEVAQENLDEKTDVNILEKLDREYPGWRDEHCENQKVHMVPCVFSDAATKDSKNGRKAEQVLFKLLENSKKPFGIHRCFNSESVEINTPAFGFVFHGQKYEGTEVDFIYIDITGVTVYECKGITRLDQAEDRYDTACDQLTKSMAKLGLDDDVPVNCVVAFPLCKRTKITEERNVRTLFKEDCENALSFSNWLSQSYREKLPFTKYVEVVQKFLYKYHAKGSFYDFKRRAVSGPADQLEKKTIVFYTKEQAEVLEADCFQNMWVTGSAGSGKTFLLKERVKWLVNHHEHMRDKSILVVTYNRAISQDIRLYLKGERDDKRIRVQTFRKLLCNILNPKSKPQVTKDPDDVLVEKILSKPDLLAKYFKSTGCIKYCHILIDEAQDLSGRWLDLMKGLVNQRNSSIWLFSDPYQMVRRGTKMPDDDELRNFERRVITRVLRNTLEVFQAYEYCFDSQDCSEMRKPIVDHNIIGKSPEYIEVKNDDEICEKLLVQLQNLQSKRISLLDCVVLTQGNSECIDNHSQIKEFLVSRDIFCTDAWDGITTRYAKRKQADPPVIIDTLQKFKGLEAKVVIFCVIGSWTPRDVDLYVGFSRSLCHLIVIGASETISKIREKQRTRDESS